MLVQLQRFPKFRSDLPGFDSVLGNMFDLMGDEFISRNNVPALNIAESGNETFVYAELPGVKKEDVKLSFENNILTIKASRNRNELPEKAQWLRNEIRSGEVQRSIRVPKGIDAGKISAELTNGILKISLPKAEEMKPREIVVK